MEFPRISHVLVSQESFLQRLKCWNEYPGLFEPVFSPSNFSFLSTDGNNLSKTSFRFFQENYTHLFVFIRENFRADVIRLDICPREDETKFRLLFDRSIAGGQDIDTIVDTSFFPLFGWIFPSRWIEKRKSEILWRRRLISYYYPQCFDVLRVSWKIQKTVNCETDFGFWKIFWILILIKS